MWNTEVAATRRTGKPGESKDMLLTIGGLALLAGIIGRNKFLGYAGLGAVVGAALPDLIRYAKISSM